MDNLLKWLISIVCGFIGMFFQQYGLFFLFVGLAIVFDCITGLIKANLTNEGLSSKIGWKGFWKKIALLVGLSFGIYLDYVVPLLFVKGGINLNVNLPFALIICCYIILNECISICENLYEVNPEGMPKWICTFLKVAKNDVDSKSK